MHRGEMPELNIPGAKFHRGKVRDNYKFMKNGQTHLASVCTDRISAFDDILPFSVHGKGAILNNISSIFLEKTRHIVPNWMIETPHANVTVGKYGDRFPVEMVIRGYLSGHAWREYKLGKRMICGVRMPEGMKENDKFPEPIITPTTKAEEGHDLDLSKKEIIRDGLVASGKYERLEHFTRKLFAFGSNYAKKRGLILVDTKYEFAEADGEIFLIDEVHTPDSSRYFYLDGYKERQRKGSPQRQLSKEFVREWLMAQEYQGREGDVMPPIPEEFIQQITIRYSELYKVMTGEDVNPNWLYPLVGFEIQKAIENSIERITTRKN